MVKSRAPIKASALMGRGGAAEGEGSPAAAGGRGRQGCLSAAVEKCKEKRKPAAFFVSPQGVRLSCRFMEARRSGACADETQVGTNSAGKMLQFLLGQHRTIQRE